MACRPALRAFTEGGPEEDAGPTPSPLLEVTSGSCAGAGRTLREVERRHIERVLRECNGLIEGPRGAAKVLDMHPSTLRHRMRKLDIHSVALLTKYAIREGLTSLEV